MFKNKEKESTQLNSSLSYPDAVTFSSKNSKDKQYCYRSTTLYTNHRWKVTVAQIYDVIVMYP